MQWTKPTFQILSTIIASGLAATAFTALISIINQPQVDLDVIPHRTTNPLDKTASLRTMDNEPTQLDHFEIRATNNGRTSADGLKLSMFFFGKIIQAKPIVYGENITLDYENISATKLPANSHSIYYDVP